jgi:CHAD domain-containing protein
MALNVVLPGNNPERPIGLEVWMGRVLELAERVKGDWDADAVHDLRVALRRCRTMADALDEVNPHPGWGKLKRASRKVFDTLGELRDAQVERIWLKDLGLPSDPVRKHMMHLLAYRVRKQQEKAEKALDRLDHGDWRKWARKLQVEARFFPLESVVFQRLALTRLNEVVELYNRARKGRSRIAWHRLRIGLKHFRYIVENFLPQRYDVWANDLKRMQDLLGEVHDLDVLRAGILRNCSELNPDVVAPWLEKIEAERKARLNEFRAITTENGSLWLTWRAGFQWGHALKTASPVGRGIA